METQRLTEYERRRLENIKRNDEMLTSCKIKSKLADLTAFTKPRRVETNISRKVKPKTPTVTRRSLRTQGKVPDSTGLKNFKQPKRAKTFNSFQQKFFMSISMKDANTCSKSDQILISQLKNDDVHGRVKALIDLDSMKLAPKNVANVLPGKIGSIKFFPLTDTRMVVVRNNYGTIGNWNVDSEKEDGDGIYKYHANPGRVSAILIQPFLMNKLIVAEYPPPQRAGAHESGAEDEDYYARALLDYEAKYGMSFTLRHCWEVLKVHPIEQSLGNIGDAEEDEVQELRRPMAICQGQSERFEEERVEIIGIIIKSKGGRWNVVNKSWQCMNIENVKKTKFWGCSESYGSTKGGDQGEVDCKMVVKEIVSRISEEEEKLEWWFEQDIDDEGEENEEGDGEV
ncbi:hypothetical protein Tco_1467228 [Tanacetum coccineum]